MRRTLLVLAIVVALAVAVAACGGSDDNGTAPTQGPTATDGTGGGTVDAAALFADNCAGCHGTDGSGGFGPDLRNEDNADGVAQKVTSGGDKMPAFSDKLSSDEIQALAEYVTTQL